MWFLCEIGSVQLLDRYVPLKEAIGPKRATVLSMSLTVFPPPLSSPWPLGNSCLLTFSTVVTLLLTPTTLVVSG